MSSSIAAAAASSTTTPVRNSNSNNNNDNIAGRTTEEEKGYVHIYTGNGKGKTTAAIGLAVRAMMAGKKVFVGQFVKSEKYHETKLEAYMNQDQQHLLCINQYGNGCFIYKNEPTHHDKMMAVAGLVECERLLLGISTTIPAQVARSSGAAASDEIIDHSGTHYDMIILDELTIALRYNLIDIHDVVRIIQQRTPKIEVVITGRDAPHELIQIGDVVTEMNCIKHYYRDQGVQARDGIER